MLPDNPKAAISYDHLIRLECSGVREIYPEGANHPYDVAQLLGDLRLGAPQPEEQFIAVLRKVLTELDTEETAASKANEILMLQPNFFGFGVNINNILKQMGFRARK